MRRPAGYQWEPLGLSADPVPGDPQAISEDVAHLAMVTSQLQSQVTALRRIAGGSEDIGKTADQIRSAASDLIGGLTEVKDRYQKVTSALSGWIPELEQAQAWSVQALNMAEAPYTAMKNTPAPPGLLVSTGPDGLPQVPDPLQGALLGPGQQAEFDQYRAMLVRSHNELQAAHSLLNRAVQLRDSQAKHYADQINSACDDALVDSGWDKFIDLVSQWAWLIKDICTALEVIAAVVAVLALIFSGAELLVLLGAALTFLATVGRAALAATGNGSWTDFAMDAVALATFGMGEVGAKALAAVAEDMPTIARVVALAKYADALDRFEELFGSAARQRVEKKFLATLVHVFKESDATTLAERLCNGGDAKVANLVKTISGIVTKLGDDPEIASLAEKAEFFEKMIRGSFVAGNAATVVGLAGGGVEIDGPDGKAIVDIHVPGISGLYADLENRTTTDNGLPAPAPAVDVPGVTITPQILLGFEQKLLVFQCMSSGF
jgi:hypothetical protein